MSPQLLQRQLALAGVALVSTLGTLALDRAEAGGGGSSDTETPTVVAPRRDAVVGAYGPGLFGRTTACGVKLTRETRGVAHPELPCGVRLVVANGGREIETAVIDKALYGPQHDFDVTQALAEDLGLAGVQIVRWRFAEKSG